MRIPELPVGSRRTLRELEREMEDLIYEKERVEIEANAVRGCWHLYARLRAGIIRNALDRRLYSLAVQRQMLRNCYTHSRSE